MIRTRKSEDRGHANHGWLDSYHTFSFADYYDADFTGFGDLVVINEDRIDAGTGFGTHGHKNMEIVTYVIQGALEHKDSLGTGSVLRPGDVQRMSAGRGIRHSEFNHSKTDPLHLLQIWITPAENGVQPGYEEKNFSAAEKANNLRLLVSQTGTEGSLRILQDVSIYSLCLDKGKDLTQILGRGRRAWVQLIRGELAVNGVLLKSGDAAYLEEEGELRFSSNDSVEALVFDLR